MDAFAVFLVGSSEADGFRDIWVFEQRGIDFKWRDFFSASVDKLFQPAGKRQVAVVIKHALVAGAEPSIYECIGVGFVVVVVAPHDVFTFDDDLAAVTDACQLPSVFVGHDGDFDASGLSHGSGDACAGRQGAAGHLVRGFGHAVGFEDGCAETVFEGIEHGWCQSGGA